MKIEFTAEEDIEQACYEATLDLNLYITHLLNIAERCERSFPEVAAGLRGSASGIGQYLHGVDGKWKSRMNVELRGALMRPEFHDHLWAYEFSRDPRGVLLLFGNMVAVAAAKPQLKFWEVLAQSRAKFSDLEPLLEKLLASSPRRRKQ